MSNSLNVSRPETGLIIREREPLNLESPFDQLREFLTPNDLFYVRSHFKGPHVKDGFELRVEGAVREPFSIGLEELQRMPSVTRAATLECAGNGRVFLSPQAEGAQWQLGAVGTAEWTGVRLGDLLERAGVAKDALEIVLEAAGDTGAAKEKPVPPGEIRYARSIAVEKTKDVLLAYRMNGLEMTEDHGFPLRAIVPGFYGMASVKWLTHVRVVTAPFTGYWQTSDYAYWDEVNGNPVRRPLENMALKSSIARPRMREFVPAGGSYEVFGAAWGGASELEGIEVSTDGGETWAAGEFIDPAEPFCWRRWRFAWALPEKSGTYVLKSRARNEAGEVQPAEHDKRFGSYVIHHTVGVEVVVH